jgi:hypothetical protein
MRAMTKLNGHCNMSTGSEEIGKASHMTEFFIKSVEEEVAQLCTGSSTLRYTVHALARLFQLNELELVAWKCVVKKALYGETQSMQLISLQYSVYLTKSLMCETMSFFDQIARLKDPKFDENYTLWLSKHRRCKELDIRTLHNQFKDMWSLGKVRSTPDNLNQVVDDIVNAKTHIKIDEQPMFPSESLENAVESSEPCDVLREY